MYRSYLITAVIFLFTTLFTPVFAGAADNKDKVIMELLEVMNTSTSMETSLETMKETIKMNTPYFIKEIKVILARELEEKDVQLAADNYRADDFGADRLYVLFRDKFNTDRVTHEIMLPVYREHYTESELRELIAFYTSELGQKTLKLTPTISRTISSKTRDMSQMALNQAKEAIADELIEGLNK